MNFFVVELLKLITDLLSFLKFLRDLFIFLSSLILKKLSIIKCGKGEIYIYK